MDGEKYKSMTGEGGGVVGIWCGGGRGGCGRLKGAVVRLMSCNAPLKVSRLLSANTLEGNMFQWAIVPGKKLFF